MTLTYTQISYINSMTLDNCMTTKNQNAKHLRMYDVCFCACENIYKRWYVISVGITEKEEGKIA